MGRLGEHMGEGASIEGAGGTAAPRAPKKYKIRVRGVVCVMVHRRAQRVRIFGRGDGHFCFARWGHPLRTCVSLGRGTKNIFFANL